MKRLLSGILAWWAFLHVLWMVSTFFLFGVLVISDDNPLQAMFEWLYDAYAFGVFRMRGWVILGFAPACWLFNYLATGSFRFLPWRHTEWLSGKKFYLRVVAKNTFLALAILFWGPLSMADHHETPSSSTSKLWVCNYHGGKTINVLRDWRKNLNALSDQISNEKFRP